MSARRALFWRVSLKMLFFNSEESSESCVFSFSYIYAFGGWVGEDIGGAIERYDPSNDAWSVVAKMEEPRFSMGIVVHAGKIYLMGGCTHSRRHMQELVSYNPVRKHWVNFCLV